MIVVIILFFLFCFFVIIYKRNKWASLLVLVHLLSVSTGLILDYKMRFQIEGVFWVFVICLYLYLIIYPWGGFRVSSTIRNDYGNKLNYFSNVIIFLGVFASICFIPVLLLLYSMDLDPNEFRYKGGIDDFLSSPLMPIPNKILTIITYSAFISILALPLHFYFLSIGKNKKALFAMIASFAYVLRGVMNFSRAVPISYMMMYFMLYILFYKNIDSKVLSIIKKGAFVIFVIMLINVSSISSKRFEDHYDFYQTEYPQNKELLIQNPIIVSYVDYLCQGYYNGYDLLNKYKGVIFYGQTTFHDFLLLMNQYLGIPFTREKYKDLREKIWPGAWSVTFNGYVAYVVYDFGIIGSFLITFLYYLYIKKKCIKMRKGHLTLSDFSWMMLFLQIPLFSIFYSTLGALVIPAIFLFLLNLIFKQKKYCQRIIM